MRWLVCLALGAVACGDNIYVMQPDELAGAYVDAQCGYYVRCGLFRDAADCTAVVSWQRDPDTAAAVDAGIVVWHADVAEAALDHIDKLSCDPTDAAHREPIWFGLYTGAKHYGEPCTFGMECISQECWLEGAACTDACCTGYCTGEQPPVVGGIGDRCRYSDCAEGYCDGNVCLPLLGDSEPCTDAAQCEIGLSCNGHCMRLPNAGEPCVDACREIGQRCNGITERCERVVLRGERCDINDDCSPFYLCSSTENSVCWPPVLGDSCFGAFTCVLPAVCDFGTFKCIAPKPDGEACFYNRDCASGNCGYPARICTSEACL